ncbi:TraB/GumN family protein [uncultured Ruminococcus sp.]|uniref:TraB/GumN family protein n=1 Tax=uncultured Ruminococcus sp. TaxID=165186 RepID=UPI0025DF1143|nr:TraB/GumN family protein [uncultured Ruminococcus sp.]
MGRVSFFAALSAAVIAFSAVSCSHQIHVDDTESDVKTTVTGEGEKETESGNTEKTTDDINSYIKVKKAKPAMWKVTDTKTGNEMYMLGIMRFATQYTFDLPDYVDEAYQKCSGVVIESDFSAAPDPQQLQEYMNHTIYNDGTTVKDHISKETYEAAKEYLSKYSYYNESMDGYSANGWASQVNGASIQRVENLVMENIDSKYMTKATQDGKEVLGLEGLSVQIEVMDACSDELSDFMISDTVRRAKDIRGFTSNLAYQYDCWARGDIDALDEEYYWNDRSSDLDDDYAKYLEVSLYKRNVNMADKLEEYLGSGNKYFVVIGVTHFSGTRGIDDLLTEKGYKVELVK